MLPALVLVAIAVLPASNLIEAPVSEYTATKWFTLSMATLITMSK